MSACEHGKHTLSSWCNKFPYTKYYTTRSSFCDLTVVEKDRLEDGEVKCFISAIHVQRRLQNTNCRKYLDIFFYSYLCFDVYYMVFLLALASVLVIWCV